ncbi:MAG: sensor histidine kinase [Chitinophagaceae bacterium]
MELSNEFSIYRTRKGRVLIHILYWLGLSFFVQFVNTFSFNLSPFSKECILFTLGVTIAVIVVHYFICHFMFRHIRKKKWLLVAFDLVMVYVLYFLILKLVLIVVMRLYPNHAGFVMLDNNLSVSNLWNISNRRRSLVIGILSFIVWYNGPGLILKIAKDYHESTQEKLAIARERNSMEINFLRAQIQPHFLFNSLNSIYGLVIENEKASKVVIQLADLLRFSLYDSTREHITLKEEVGFLTNYLQLEKIRHKESRVQIEYDFSRIGNLEKTIKPLMLVNFVENAFKHGINASIHNAWIKLSITEKDGLLTFHSVNNKPVAAINKKTNESAGGLGLKNVQRRLELEYPARYKLDVHETTDAYEVVLILHL